jgi:hypothetical protein
MQTQYEPPKLEVIGSVQELTQQDLDKIGSVADIFTQLIPQLDGEIQPD